MRVALWVASSVLIVGCKKEKPATPPPPPGPTAPTSTADQDALWALAPEGVKFGAVVSPRGVASLEAAALAFRKAADQMPELADAKRKLDEQIKDALGTDAPTLGTLGLSNTKGFALFVIGEEPPVVVLPVGDRDAFLKAVKGTKGTDSDTIKRATCKPVKGFYACARDAGMFDRLGKGNLKDALALVGARGDIEVAGVIPAAGQEVPVAAVVQLARGQAVVRAAVKGVPLQIGKLVANAKPRADGDRISGFGLIQPGPMLAKVPPMPIVPGLSADELARSIAGPITMATPTALPATGAPIFDIRIPVSDPAPAQKLVDQCGQLLPPQLGASVKNGVCHVAVPGMTVELDAWVENKELRLGKKGGTPEGPAVALSPIGKELAAGEWVIAFFGRGTVLAPFKLPPIPAANLQREALLGFRVFMAFNEMGFGVRVDGDTVRVLASIRTLWANPDDVVAKLLAISPADLLAGKGSQTAKAIVDASPSSPFAADYAAGLGGLTMPAAAVGMLAAVAIPAFMDYMKKSKRSEAALMLNKLGKNLKVAHATTGEFPKGTVALSPDRSCCDFDPDRKCQDPDAWTHPVWQELDFSIDEPHLYRYSYESDGKLAAVRAVGDLDCDGTEVAYQLTALVKPDGSVETMITEPPPNSD